MLGIDISHFMGLNYILFKDFVNTKDFSPLKQQVELQHTCHLEVRLSEWIVMFILIMWFLQVMTRFLERCANLSLISSIYRPRLSCYTT